MRTIKATEFKAKCLKIMDDVARTGESVLITKNGVPIAHLVPAERRREALFGAVHGTVVISGDFITPIEPRRWDVAS